MSGRLLAIVSLFTITTLASSSDDPAQKGAKEGTARTVKVTAQVPGVIDFVGSTSKPLAVGDRVAKGQVLVQLDDVLAKIDRQAGGVDPQRKLKAAHLLATESEHRMTRAMLLFEAGAIAREDKDAAILTHNKYRNEAATLQRLLELAQAGPKPGPTPFERADLAVEMHCLRSPFNGVVRAIYKTRGEGVKSSETILLIEEVRE